MVFQCEIAWRQILLHKALQEPLLNVQVSKSVEYYSLLVENVGSIPAYSVGIRGIFDKSGKLIPLAIRFQKVQSFYSSCLRPKEQIILATISIDFYNEYLDEDSGFIEISYYDRFYEEKVLRCYFFTKGVVTIPIKEKPIGFLLTLIDDYETLKTLQRLKNYILGKPYK